jgi:hypothetical protein
MGEIPASGRKDYFGAGKECNLRALLSAVCSSNKKQAFQPVSNLSVIYSVFFF